MPKIRFSIFLIACLSTFAATAIAAPGDFDTTFGKGGVLDLSEASGRRIPAPTINYPGIGSTLALGQNGSIYVGGGFTDVRNGYNVRSFVARVLGHGQLDPSFSTGGILLRSGFRGSTATTDTIAVLQSGRIITSDVFFTDCPNICPPGPAAGRIAQSFGPMGMPIARVEDGYVVRTSPGHDGVNATAVFKDGGVVEFNRYYGVGVAGISLVVKAVRANGERDINFEQNTDRKIACPIKTGIWKIIAKVDKQDRLVTVVSGPDSNGGVSFTTCVTRLHRDGLPDTRFGAGGVVTFNDAITRPYMPQDIAFSAEGGVRIAIQVGGTRSKKVGQIRLTAAGLPDGRFADGAIAEFEAPLAGVATIKPLPNGDTVLAGYGNPPRYISIGVPSVVRMAGSIPDTRFGLNGAGISVLSQLSAGVWFYQPVIVVSEVDESVFVLGSNGAQLIKLQGTPPPTSATARYEGLWWRSPAGSEAGWGVNLSHQGDVLFATWFTYDLDGSGMWLVMPKGERTGDGKFTGALYRTTGSPFSQPTFDAALTKTIEVGTATFDFSDANNGLFTYRLNGITQTKPITRQEFGAMPVCTPKTLPAVLANYQGLWWNAPENSESGWGIHLTHQSDTLFATWFTYDAEGRGMWLVMSKGERTPATTPTYTGTLYRARGPAFNASPWLASRVSLIPVGLATLSFTDANTAQFYSIVDGFSQKKQLTRQIFASPASDCR